jgi:CubicO group peptidase (beta-lactamase class C family)
MEIRSPESVGMSSARLQRLDRAMHEFVREDRAPGIVTLVQRHGHVVHLGTYGKADIAAGTPMRTDALFRIYSMTKPIVCVALMTLFEEGRFSLQEPLATFIPAFKTTKVYTGLGVAGPKYVDLERPITVHHLLTHTAGLGYGLFLDSPVEDLYREIILAPLISRDRPLSAVIDDVAQLPLLYQPGTRWYYSIAVDVLGQVIQVVSGMPLEEFLQERLFTPLGMVDTAFAVPADKVQRLAALYASDAEALYRPHLVAPSDTPAIGDVTLPTAAPSGGGGLVSSVADYLAFARCLLQGGAYEGGRILSRKTVAWMTANHIPASFFPLWVGSWETDFGFGLGFRVTVDLGQARALTSVGAFGWEGMANTYFWVDPAEDFIGVLMTQYLPVDPYPLQDAFRNLAYLAIVD